MVVSVTGIGRPGAWCNALSIFQVTRNRLAIYTQAVANIALAAWLYNEYLHNIFMQQYLANLWGSLGLLIVAGVSVMAVAMAGIMMYSRKGGFSAYASTQESTGQNLALSTLLPIDMCPICNSTLRTLSGNRLQCRKCKRYFKK